jgi:c-di-GMP-binding flagellar brake protein YcgR
VGKRRDITASGDRPQNVHLGNGSDHVMMETVELWTRQLLEVECEDGLWYQTQILKIEDGRIYIQHPVNKYLEYMPLSDESSRNVAVYFCNDRKELYMYHTVLNVKDGKPVLAGLPHPGNMKKVHRRNYFRVPARANIEILKPSGEIYSLMTEDLSGGGASFISPDPNLFQLNEEVNGVIRLQGKSELIRIPFVGKIANAKTIPGFGRKFGVCFTGIKEKHRSQIIRFCLKRQSEIRNKLEHYTDFL